MRTSCFFICTFAVINNEKIQVQIMQLTLSEQEKASVLRTTGVSYDEILSMDIEDLQRKIEKRLARNFNTSLFTTNDYLGEDHHICT